MDLQRRKPGRSEEPDPFKKKTVRMPCSGKKCQWRNRQIPVFQEVGRGTSLAPVTGQEKERLMRETPVNDWLADLERVIEDEEATAPIRIHRTKKKEKKKEEPAPGGTPDFKDIGEPS